MDIIIRDIGEYPEMTPRYGWELEWATEDDENRFAMLIPEPNSFRTITEAKAEAELFKDRVSKAAIIVDEQ